MCGRDRIIKIATVFLILCLGKTSFAEQRRPHDPDYIFYEASRCYEAAQYKEAIAEYSLLLKQDLESGPLHYNLGNCYLKKGELGRAILNYERAKRIIPSDGDLEANYKYATSLIQGTSPGDAAPWYEQILERLFGGLSLNGLIILLSMIYAFSMLIFIARIYFKGLRRYSMTAIAILIALFISGSLSLYGRISAIGKEAIAIMDQAEVKREPFDRAPAHFILYEGMKIRVIDSKGEWIKISTSDKKVGWVRPSTIEVI